MIWAGSAILLQCSPERKNNVKNRKPVMDFEIVNPLSFLVIQVNVGGFLQNINICVTFAECTCFLKVLFQILFPLNAIHEIRRVT